MQDEEEMMVTWQQSQRPLFKTMFQHWVNRIFTHKAAVHLQCETKSQHEFFFFF